MYVLGVKKTIILCANKVRRIFHRGHLFDALEAYAYGLRGGNGGFC